MKIQLGQTVTDVVTGVKGVVTGRAEYMTGCSQCLVQPKAGDDGKYVDSLWFDEQRLDVDQGSRVIVLDNSETPGFDKPAPRR